VKIRGVRIELGEVENLLKRCAILSQVAVKAVEGELYAYVATCIATAPAVASDQACTGERGAGPGEEPAVALRALRGAAHAVFWLHCQQELPPAMYPRAVLLVPGAGLPLNASGKVDRAALPQPSKELLAEASMAGAGGDVAREGQTAPTTAERAATHMELYLQEMWAELLGLPANCLRLSSNFFLVGGHSLAALKLMNLLWKAIGEDATTGGGEILRPDRRGENFGALSVKKLAECPTLEAREETPPMGDDSREETSPMGDDSKEDTPPIGDDSKEDTPPTGDDSSGILAPGGTPSAQGDDASGGLTQGSPSQLARFSDHWSLAIGYLFAAAAEGDVVLLRALLAVGVDPNGGVTRHSRGTTPLHAAVANRHTMATRALIEGGAKLTLGANGCTAFHLASQGGPPELLKLFLGLSCHNEPLSAVAVTLPEALSPLPLRDLGAEAISGSEHVANDTALPQEELPSGASRGESTTEGRHTRIERGGRDGAIERDKSDGHSRGPGEAQPTGSIPCTVLPATQPTVRPAPLLPLSIRDKAKQTALHYAARAGHVQNLRLLLTRPDVVTLLEHRDRWQRTPLHWAALNGFPEALQTLLDAGAKPKPDVAPMARMARDTTLPYETPLQSARRHDHSTCVELLLKAGATD
ncbi:hypothetical protein CYMTET_26560, partial [Cymbomonas tetramitiformis]